MFSAKSARWSHDWVFDNKEESFPVGGMENDAGNLSMQERKCENSLSEVFTISNVEECKEKESSAIDNGMKSFQVWAHGFC